MIVEPVAMAAKLVAGRPRPAVARALVLVAILTAGGAGRSQAVAAGPAAPAASPAPVARGKAPALVTVVREPTVPAAGGKPAPLLILMHGLGADERDLLPLAQKLDGRLRIVLPRAPLAAPGGGAAWFGMTWDASGDRLVDAADVITSPDAVLALVDDLVARGVADRRRVFVGGFSQGGMMAVLLAVRFPDRFAGALCLSGRLPLEHRARWAAKGRGRWPKVLMIHGTSDRVIGVARARASRDELVALGVDVALVELPMAHQIADRALALAQAWLAERLADGDAR